MKQARPRSTRSNVLSRRALAGVAGGKVNREFNIGMPPSLTATRGDDDPNGSIIIIGRDGP